MGNPIGLALLAFIPVLILLHYFKTRRSEVKVASISIWRSVLDASAKRRSSRFSLDIDLILLITALLFAAIGATDPKIPPRAGQHALLCIVIDCSASMKADDAFDKAIAFAQTAISAEPANKLVTIASSGAVPRIVCRRASQNRALDVIRSLSPEDAYADNAEAILLMRGIEPSAKPLLLTDRFDQKIQDADVASFGSPMENAGFVAAQSRANGLFVALANYSSNPYRGAIHLVGKGNVNLKVADITLEAGERRDLVLQISEIPPEAELRLIPPSGAVYDDALYVASAAKALKVAVAGVKLPSASRRGILGALDSIGGVQVLHIEGDRFPDDIEADAYIGVRTQIHAAGAPAVLFQPTEVQGIQYSGEKYSGDIAIADPPHSYFVGADGSKLSVFRSFVNGEVMGFDASWTPVLKVGDTVALAHRDSTWVASFSPSTASESWVSDPSFLMFLSRFISDAGSTSRRVRMAKTNASRSKSGHHDGIAYNLLSDEESDLRTRQSNDAPIPIPVLSNVTGVAFSLGNLLFMLAIAALVARMLIAGRRL